MEKKVYLKCGLVLIGLAIVLALLFKCAAADCGPGYKSGCVPDKPNVVRTHINVAPKPTVVQCPDPCEPAKDCPKCVCVCNPAPSVVVHEYHKVPVENIHVVKNWIGGDLISGYGIKGLTANYDRIIGKSHRWMVGAGFGFVRRKAEGWVAFPPCGHREPVDPPFTFEGTNSILTVGVRRGF